MRLSLKCFFVSLFTVVLTDAQVSLAQSNDGPPWIDMLKQKIVEHICQDGGKWLECYDQRPADCSRVVKEFANPCIDKTAKGAATEMDTEQAAQLSKNMVDCFNASFETNYGAWRKRTPKCQKPPQHLQ